MSKGFMAPRGLLERKAPHGHPCTRCGLCCMAELCDLAAAVFKRPRKSPGPCPALVKNGNDYGCGLVLHPELPQHMRDAAALLIGATGPTGCDARFNGEPVNEAHVKASKRYDTEHAGEFVAARKLWGMWP